MVTMREIAQKAGVSVSTVSLVLSGKDSGRVRKKDATRIRRLAHDLGYKTNPLARSLRTNKTRMLGFISEEVATTPFAGRLILGAQDAASQKGYVMLTVNTDGLSSEKEEIDALKRYGVDGFLYAKMYNRYVHLPDEIQGQPTVLVDAMDADGSSIPSISPDEFRIGYDATRRLLAAGCQRIAYIGCSDPMIAEEGRRQGYHSALREAGLSADPKLEIAVNNEGKDCQTVGDLWDRCNPDGFFCFNDARALYVYLQAARRGLYIGQDISVIGVDNHQVFAQTLTPRLTTIGLPHYEMGYWAVSKVIDLIESDKEDLSGGQGSGGEEDELVSAAGIPMPSLDSVSPVRLHCPLIEKNSIVAG